MELLCWSQVEDYARWRAVFDADGPAHVANGLELVRIWRDRDAPERVHFLFSVEDEARALAYLEAPESARAGVAGGVLDGGYAFVEPLSITR